MIDKETLGIAGQWLACFLVGIGIGVEFATRASVGHLVITVGSMVFAIATKVRYYRR